MVKTQSTLLPIFGTAVAVSLSVMVLLYYEKRKNSAKKNKGKDIEKENRTEQENENDVIDDVTACSSRTSYTSFDDEEMKSCQAASSSTSAYSTASDDSGPFPVGGYSTYKQQEVDLCKDINNLDIQEVFNSPIVENHCLDERIRKSPINHDAKLDQFCTSSAFQHCDVESTKLKSIVVPYNDIVPPLKPNTGEIIHPSKIS